MARRTFSDMLGEVLLRMGNRTDITATQREFFLNDAYFIVAKGFDHVQLQGEGSESLLTGAGSLTPVSITDLWWPMLVRDETHNRELIPEDMTVIDNMQRSSGQPGRFYWYNSTFVFDNLSDADVTLKLKYKKKPARLAGSDISVLDDLYDPLIIMKGAQLGLETSRDFDGAVAIAKLYRNYISEHGLIPSQEEKKNDYRNNVRVRFR